MARSKQEIEFKWHVRSKKDFETFLRVAKQLSARLSRAQKKSIRDLYLDTQDKQLARQGLKARLRRMNGRWEINVKRTSVLKKGLASREEITLPLRPSPLNESKGIQQFEKKMKRKATGVWEKLFRIQNRRLTRWLALPDRTLAEVSFDRVKISRGPKTIRMMEIELEFICGNLKTFKSFIRRVNMFSTLQPSKRSKVATAVHAFAGIV